MHIMLYKRRAREQNAVNSDDVGAVEVVSWSALSSLSKAFSLKQKQHAES